MTVSWHSLSVKLSVRICSAILVCLACATALMCVVFAQRLTARLNDQGLNTASETAYMLDRIFVQGEQITRTLAHILETQTLPPDAVSAVLRETTRTMNRHCRELNGMGIAYLEDMLAPGQRSNFFVEYEIPGGYASVRLTDADGEAAYFTADWFVIPLALEKPVWTIPYIGAASGKLLFSYAAPFFRETENGRTAAGVIEVAIKVEDLEKFLDNEALESLRKLSNEGEVFLMNQFGQIILYPGKEALLSETVFTLCDTGAAFDAANRSAAKTLLQNRSGKIALRGVPQLKGDSEIFHAACVNGWVVGIVIPQAWKTPLLVPMITQFLLWTVALIGVVAILIFVTCRKLTQPLVRLSDAAQEIGGGNFDAPLPRAGANDEVGALTHSFAHMQTALRDYTARLEETVAARERSEGELNAAKAIQQDILPGILPPVPDCPDLVCAAKLIPARGVGGDLYDMFPIDARHWALIIGDVSGKGVPAALFMAVTQTLQRSIAGTRHTPDAIVTQLNDMLAKDNSTEMFVTYWLGVLDITTGTLAYTNGGHNPPLVKHADGTVEMLKRRHGPMLGIVGGKTYGADTATLTRGDMLILYTDGVTEAVNDAGELLGTDTLVATVADNPMRDPDEMLCCIENAVFIHTDGAEQFDDITLLIAQYGHPDKFEKTLAAPAEPDRLEAVMTLFDEFPKSGELSHRARNRFRVCIEEIFANIVMHAYDGNRGIVTVRIWEEAGQVRMSFADAGRKFNPLEHPEPDLDTPASERPIGGLGIHLIRKQMDFVSYDYDNGKNILTIGKTLENRHAENAI